MPQAPAHIELTLVGLRRRIRTAQGLTVPVVTAHGVPEPDVVLVPAFGDKMPDTLSARLTRPDVPDAVAALQQWSTAGAHLGAACSGSFLLAESGLLDGHRATTSWWLGPMFRQRYPNVTLDESRMIVNSTRFTTAGAALAHVDLALRIIRGRSPALAGTMRGMDQITLGLGPLPKKTRKEVFLDEMNQVVPWPALVALIQPHARGAHQALGGRPPFSIETMLRIHCLQLWWNLSDPAVEEELHERPLYRRFVGLDCAARMPDETTILRFRHLLEKHQLAPQVLATINAGLAQQGLLLKSGTVVDATLIAAPSSTKNKDGERDPEMHQTKKGNQWHFGMKAHIGVDADSGLVHTVIGTAANVNDVTQAAGLLHGEETDAWGDAGYQGVAKREELKDCNTRWHVAMRPGKRKALDPERELHQLIEKAERLKASIRAKVEHPFRVVKQQFGHAKVRYRGLAKNTARLTMLFALGNLWMVRRQILEARG